MTIEDNNNKLIELTKPLTKDDIEIRTGSCSQKGASFLLYKTARVDTKRFNSVFGLDWKREHRVENGHYICKISIFNDITKEWICREDVGTESNTEKEKGAFSDAFKRAGSSFGVGIELYEAPFIFIKDITKPKVGGKFELEDQFYSNNLIVQKYEYSQKDGLQIEIYHTKDKKIVFSNFKSGKFEPKKEEEKPINKTEHKNLAENISEKKEISLKEQIQLGKFKIEKATMKNGDIIDAIKFDNGDRRLINYKIEYQNYSINIGTKEKATWINSKELTKESIIEAVKE